MGTEDGGAVVGIDEVGVCVGTGVGGSVGADVAAGQYGVGRGVESDIASNRISSVRPRSVD